MNTDTKNILLFGDSNTWGFDPACGGRFPYRVRWTTICAEKLGTAYNCIPCGMNGRTTIFDDPLKGCRNGLDALDFELQTNKPLDLLVIMLGTNDLKYTDAAGSAEGLKKIIEKATSYSIYSVSEKIIDKINILNATKLAMINAVENLKIKPDILFIDALELDIDIKQISIIKGDSKSYSIGCASILAKVNRDNMMDNLPEKYQKYKISKNKGYGTKEHLEAIEKYAPSDMHRFSFEPIKSYNHKYKK